MTNPVMILTDSSVYLPAGLVAHYPIRIMPFTLNWDGMTYRDGVDIQDKEFYERLSRSNSIPTTSQVTAGELHQYIQPLLAEGYDVLLLLISSGLSSSYLTAVNELKKFPRDRVAILDTKLVAMPLGFQVLASARAAMAGANLAECLEVAQQMYGNIGAYFTVDNLKYLAAGGRINTAKRLLGSAINIKPVLQLRDGKIELVCGVISQRKAIARMLDLAEEAIGGRTPVYMSIIHTLAEEQARELLETARARYAPVEIYLSDLSPVIGTHVGPGVLAIIYMAGVEESIPVCNASGLMKMPQENQVRTVETGEPAYV